MTVYWATKLRGFLKHISTYSSDVDFVQRDGYYEASSKLHLLKSRLIRSHLFDIIGLFQVVAVSGKDCDCYGSFNRFLNADKPYFIYLENPTALYHYALGRLNFSAGKKRFKRCLEHENLKYIVCMSNACRTTFEKVNTPIPKGVKIKTIYPLVPKNNYVNDELIKDKCYSEVLECLYCVQGKSFYTKGGRDVLEAVTSLQDEGYKVHLTIITHSSALDEKTKKLIESRENLSLHEFAFSYDEMEKIYSKTAVLIQPSSADSFALTVLEAIKGGCAVLGSRLYAIPEMVEEGKNGILIDPMYWTFTKDNMPNPVAWGYNKKVRLSKRRSQRYINDIKASLKSMCENRKMLYAFAKNSLEIANAKFSEENICNQWNDVWTSLKGNTNNEA